MDREIFRRQAEELVAQMTVEEAASQLLHNAPAVERLGVPSYNWWNEGLHGVGRVGTATVFPQAIGMAATFDAGFLKEEANMISEEARAKYNSAQEYGDRDIYKGLTYWSPNINIFRDPRWGRGHETYGEDPVLTSRLGVAFIEGLQGDGKYLKVAACAKHYAVHSGPEAVRHTFDARVRPKDLAETYLPAFEAAVKEAGVEAVMGAYNCVNGEPSCANKMLLQEKLRGEWGFQGHVVSDCWAVRDFHESHHYTNRSAESASLAIRRGCDLNCGCTYENLLAGMEEGLVTEKEIRESAIRVMTTRFALGMFDGNCIYNKISYDVVSQPSHKAVALRAAEKSIVLLKNNGILPLDRGKIKSIGVIGPNAYSQAALYGNYHGDSDEYITDLDGIRQAAGKGIRIFYSKGCDLWRNSDDPLSMPGRLHNEAAAVVKCSDVLILCVGLDETMEGEEGDQGNAYGSGDKENLLLPLSQQTLIEKVLSYDKPVIIVNHSGSAMDLSAYEEKCAAIIQAWYPGERGGEALGNILFGEYNPSGKLPVTFYYNDQPMPDFTDYNMAGRTYKFVEAAPWYPFGYGLSYADFVYENLSVCLTEESVNLSVKVRNTGKVDGEEIIECYLQYEGEAFEKPHYKLAAFASRWIQAEKDAECSMSFPIKYMAGILEDGSSKVLDGRYVLFVGSCQPDERSIGLLGEEKKPLAISLIVEDGRIRVGKAVSCIPYRYRDQKCYKMQIKEKSGFSLDTPFCYLCQNEKAETVLKEFLPDFFNENNPYASQMKGLSMSLNELLAGYAGALEKDKRKLLEEKLREINDKE